MAHVEITLFAGCMTARKTAMLLYHLRRARERGGDTEAWLVDPADVRTQRTEGGYLVSRNGGRERANLWTQGCLENVTPLDTLERWQRSAPRGQGDDWTLAVDEMHFATPENALALYAACRGRSAYPGTVLLAGLTTDYRGEPWPSVAALMPLVDHLVPLAADCTRCGAPATRSQRVTARTERVLVAKDAYVPWCRACFDAENAQ